MKKLKHTRTVREYVKELSSLMLDIHHMSEQFNFILGLPLCSQVEIRTQGSYDLLNLLSLSIWFLGLSSPFLSLKLSTLLFLCLMKKRYQSLSWVSTVAKTEEVLGSLPSLLTSDRAHRNEVKHLVPKHTVNIQHRGIFAYFTCVAYGVLPLVQPFSNPILYLDVALDFQQPTKIESIKTRLSFLWEFVPCPFIKI